MEKTKQTMFAQFCIRGAIFLLFFLGIFVKLFSFLLYLLIPIIIANVVLGFINQNKGIIMNILLLIIAIPVVWQIFLIDYLMIILGSFLSFLHLLLFGIRFREYSKKGEEEKKKIKK